MSDNGMKSEDQRPAGEESGQASREESGPAAASGGKGRIDRETRKALEEAGRALREAAEKTGIAAREIGRDVSAGAGEALADLRGATRKASERAREATAEALGRAKERVERREPEGGGTGKSGAGPSMGGTGMGASGMSASGMGASGMGASGMGAGGAGAPGEAPAGAGPGGAGQSGTGMDSNLAAALAYVGWGVTGLLFYVIEPNDRFVRFHALQSILLTAAFIVVGVALAVVPFIGPFFFSLAAIGFVLVWLLAMWKALRREEYLLPFIGDIARAQVDRKA